MSKNIVVLGASGGIGKAVTKLFKSDKKYKVYAYTHKQLDVTDFQQFKKLPKDIDCLINCAGYFNEEEPQKMWDVNVNGAINSVTFAVCEQMKKDGYIFVVTSSAGVRINRQYPFYSFTKKEAENVVNKVLAETTAEGFSIFINTIAPARTRTKMRSKITKDWKKEVALEPEEVAEFIKKVYEADLRIYGHTFDLRLPYKK